MTESMNFYSIINALRMKRKISVRQLAQEMDLPATTLSSIMTRRPSRLSKEIVIKFGAAFGIPWYHLLNRNSADDVTTFGITKPTVAVDMDENTAALLMEHLVIPYSHGSQQQSSFSPSSNANAFQEGIILLLNRLNDEGLIKVMHFLLNIAAEPQFQKNPEVKKYKEDTEWQENAP